MRMKPIVSFDVDMTLLDHKDWTVPDSAMETLLRLREKYTIVLATGRDMDLNFSAVLKEQIKPDAIIHLNGTKITVGDEVIYQHQFDKELMKRIIDHVKCTPYGVGATIGEEDYYVHPEVVRNHDIRLWGRCGRQFGDPDRLLGLDVRTMAYIGDEAGAKELEAKFPQVCVYMFAERQGADVVEKDASKARGLLRLCEHYGTDVSQTVAFGDSMNDYDIIKTAGIGVAMGNAMTELKEAADYVTDDLWQDGIRNACVHLGLI